jgi:hypothetical protein
MTIELIRRLLSDWPLHYMVSGCMGLLAYSLMETILYQCFCKVSRSHRLRFYYLVLEYGIGLVSILAGVFLSLLSHVILDYWLHIRLF